tara:strand:+ start:902 stop:1027 length:126 start_codon:yes stop_codon:yes gene_type:complete
MLVTPRMKIVSLLIPREITSLKKKGVAVVDKMGKKVLGWLK